ncbi:hypothetical protein EBZ39_12110, partial [bacterium]|nr:hypothetical protein [bacterium]
WIKGKNFTPQKLIFGENNNFDFSKYCLIIFRLAPHHYHRFHCKPQHCLHIENDSILFH